MDVLRFLDGLCSMWTQIIGVAILLVLYCRHCAAERGREHQKCISCDSPNCVRCRAYTATSVGKLRRRWMGYVETLRDIETSRDVPEKAIERIAKTLHQFPNGEMEKNFAEMPPFRLAGLETCPFHDSTSFSRDVEVLQENWEKIYGEYQLVNRDDLPWKVNTTPSGKWKTFYLVNQGVEIATNVSLCPVTYNVLCELRNFMSNCIFGNACFSVVYPETHITEHNGPCNLRVRCHLGLDIPDGCVLVVDGKKRKWCPGKCLLFDDSYLHSVTHKSSYATSSRPRVLFLVDLWSPFITEDERRGLGYLLHPDVLQNNSNVS